jgi:hypothetical protein
MKLPLVPVYFGSTVMPNITTTPSYIHANQFKNPRHLAEYMLYLDRHPEQYEAYLAWRKSPRPFSEEYLHAMQHRVVSPEEVLAHSGSTRRAACCRLCNPEYVEWARENREKRSLVYITMSSQAVMDRYFQRSGNR